MHKRPMPRDVNQLAHAIGAIATGDAPRQLAREGRRVPLAARVRPERPAVPQVRPGSLPEAVAASFSRRYLPTWSS